MASEPKRQQEPESVFHPGFTSDNEPVNPNKGITLRSIIIGFIAIIPAVFWGVYGDVVSQTDLTSTSLMMPPILILCFLLILNAPVRRWMPTKALTQSEFVTIYVMLVVSVILSGMGMIQFLCTTLGAVPYYKTPENQWADKFVGRTPSFITPKLSAIEGFYQGSSPVLWSAWIQPMIFWSIFLMGMLFAMLCINTIVRKQWMDRERLSFPITMLPMEMTNPRTPFFKNKMMWLGFFLAAAVESTNSLNFLYPQFPYIQIRAYDQMAAFQTFPWNQMGGLQTTFYPLAIGLGFVVSLDVSFSCWFFYLLTKVQNIMVAMLGWEAGAGAMSSPPYIGQQGTGAFIGVALSLVFMARKQLRDVLVKAFRNDPEIDDTNEPMSYRMAVFGLLAGFLLMVIMCVVVGVNPLVAAIYLLLYLLFSLTITRLRAVAGPPWVMGPSLNAFEAIIQPIGSGKFASGTFVGLAHFQWFALEMRCCPMPGQLESMKMAQQAGIRQRTLTLVMIFAIVVGIAVGFWACLSVWYEFGAATAKVEGWRTFMGRLPFDRADYYTSNPSKPDISGFFAMLFGGGVALWLQYMRSQFFNFPFHPVGYVLANTETMHWLWCPMLVAWTLKALIIKYMGIRGYRQALPFFLGLVLGDYVTASLWALAGSILGITMYRCFPV